MMRSSPWLLLLLLILLAASTVSAANHVRSRQDAAVEAVNARSTTEAEELAVHPHHYAHYRYLQSLPEGLVAPEISILLSVFTVLDVQLATVRPPIIFRLAMYYSAILHNSMAVYSDCTAVDCNNIHPAVVTPVELHTTSNRLTAALQGILSYSVLSLPTAVVPVNDTLTKLAYPATFVTGPLDPAVAACTDYSCLINVAFSNNYNPIIMGQIVAKQVYNYSITDGYNQLGTEGGVCTVNCRPYANTIGYKPAFQNSTRRWEPLPEDDGRGYFVTQQMIAPQAANAQYRFLEATERNRRLSLSNPRYTLDYMKEGLRTVELMATYLPDEAKRLEVECFDNKLLVNARILQAFINKLVTMHTTANWTDPVYGVTPGAPVVTLERLIHFIMGIDMAVHDSATVVWKSKITHDLIRPLTVVRRWGQNGTNITTWAFGGAAGPPGGVQTLSASRFASYRRTQPHSEWVSGSACFFQVTKEYTEAYLQQVLGMADFTTFPVQFIIPPGKSTTQPGVLPTVEIVLSYPDLTALNDAGGFSRAVGGMHFEHSIKAGQIMCAGIGPAAVEALLLN
jgi:hypothetical protein